MKERESKKGKRWGSKWTRGKRVPRPHMGHEDDDDNITYSFNRGRQTQPYTVELTVKVKVSIALIYAMLVWVFIQHTDYEIGIV